MQRKKLKPLQLRLYRTTEETSPTASELQAQASLIQRTRAAFSEDKLMGRGMVLTDPAKFTEFHDELTLLFGTTQNPTEAPTVDINRVRAVSCSLMLESIPMYMFAKTGLLFDTDNSTIRFLSKDDAFTLPIDEPLKKTRWGSFSYNKIHELHPRNSRIPLPTIADLAAEMRVAYKNHPHTALKHNELKTTVYKQGLLGLYIQYFNRDHEYDAISHAVKTKKISKAFLGVMEAQLKLDMLTLQAEIRKLYGILLPIFIWNMQGHLQEFQPSEKNIHDLNTQALYRNTQNNFYIFLETQDLQKYEHFFSLLQPSQTTQLLQQHFFDTSGDTPLIHLIRYNQIKKAEFLITKLNIDPTQSNFTEESPLELAVKNDIELVKLILSHEKFKTRSDAILTQLNRAAQVAASRHKVDILKLLLQLGASPIHKKTDLMQVALRPSSASLEDKVTQFIPGCEIAPINLDYLSENIIKIDFNYEYQQAFMACLFPRCSLSTEQDIYCATFSGADMIEQLKEMDANTANASILERFNELFGDEITLAADKSYRHNLIMHPDGKIDFHFANKNDCEKFKAYFPNCKVQEKSDYSILTIEQPKDLTLFYESLQTMIRPLTGNAFKL